MLIFSFRPNWNTFFICIFGEEMLHSYPQINSKQWEKHRRYTRAYLITIRFACMPNAPRQVPAFIKLHFNVMGNWRRILNYWTHHNAPSRTSAHIILTTSPCCLPKDLLTSKHTCSQSSTTSSWTCWYSTSAVTCISGVDEAIHFSHLKSRRWFARL